MVLIVLAFLHIETYVLVIIHFRFLFFGEIVTYFITRHAAKKDSFFVGTKISMIHMMRFFHFSLFQKDQPSCHRGYTKKGWRPLQESCERKCRKVGCFPLPNRSLPTAQHATSNNQRRESMEMRKKKKKKTLHTLLLSRKQLHYVAIIAREIVLTQIQR